MTEIRHEPVAPTRRQWLASGAEIDAHRHDDHQIIYAARGVLTVTTDAGSWVTPGTRAIWVPAGTVHAHPTRGEAVQEAALRALGAASHGLAASMR